MLLEFSVIPVGEGIHMGDQVAAVLDVVDASGLAYQLTPSGTCVEGDWDDLMPLLKRCRDRVRKDARRAVWVIKIDDEEGVDDKLSRNIITVEEKLGRKLGRPGP